MNARSFAFLPKNVRTQFLLLLLLLGGTLAVLCRDGFLPYHVFWANDAALGAMKASSARLPGTFAGCWTDFWWIGGAAPSASPSLSTLLAALLSPEYYLKIYVPLTMLFFGCCAWFFFRQLRFSTMAATLAGLAAGLNMHFFSNGCWGLGTWTVSCGMVFVALGILVSPNIRPLWVKGVLAGLSVGMVVMEGFDVGAIFSVYIGLFLAFLFLISESRVTTGILKTLGVGSLVVLCAFLISASTIYTLVGTQISGMQTADSNQEESLDKWNFAVQWSIPKLETLRVIIPGIFGYRMANHITSSDKSSAYWGSVAKDPLIEELESNDPKIRVAAAASPQLHLSAAIQTIMAGDDLKTRQLIVDKIKVNDPTLRHTGNGEFAGVLVCLLAAFGFASAVRKTDSPFSKVERRIAWFWAGAAIFSVVAAWGQHGFVFRFIHHLPFFANIRNPMKFMHPLTLSLIILCGFGVEALHRGYLELAAARTKTPPRRWLDWVTTTSAFEKRWIIGTIAALVLSLTGFLILSGSKASLASYLDHNGFDAAHGFEPGLTSKIAAFSINEAGLFIIYFALSAGMVITILRGVWVGKRTALAWVFFGAIMICDLFRADVPWVRYYDYQKTYSMNPVVDALRHEPWEHRITSRSSPMVSSYDIVPDGNWAQLCHWWLENDYPYNDIQSLEVDQAPRMPVLDQTYMANFAFRSTNDLSPSAYQWASTHPPENNPFWNWVLQAGPASRLWRLTNTRYIYADARFADVLNQAAEPQGSFRTVMRTDMVAKPGVERVQDFGDVTVQTNAQGPMALIEYTDTLPRAKLYSNWRIEDDPTTLRALSSRAFDPKKTVLLSQNASIAQTPGNPEADSGTAKITKYEPKDLMVETNAKASTILLLNDKFDPDWSVSVDDKPAQLLRCNYIMRGVFVPPGAHTVKFHFQPPIQFLCISVAAFVFGMLLAGRVIYSRFWGDPDPPPQGRHKWRGPNLAPA